MIKTDNTLEPFCMMILNISAVILSLMLQDILLIDILYYNNDKTKQFDVSKGKICWDRDDYYGGVSLHIFHEYEQIWVQMLSLDELRVFNCTLLTSLLQRNPFRV